MICKLCLLEKKAKSNTHYLSDFIIKTALNEDGVSTRGKGLYWGIDSRKLNVDFKFQQEASSLTLENLLGRKTTEKENINAVKNIDFTVSDKFCKECEDKFSKIETEFVNKVVSKFRNSNLQNITEKVLNENESRITRLFFLMQFWRTSVCINSFKLSAELSEKLRIKILSIDNTGLESIPLSVNFLETLKDDNDTDTGNKFKTHNLVSIIERENPCAIIMNDFVIQLYEDLQFPFYNFYGINNKADFVNYLNHNKTIFRVKILSNTKRKSVLEGYFTLAAKAFVKNHAWFFLDIFTRQFRRLPTTIQIQHYLSEISKQDDVMKFSREKLVTNIIRYLKNNYKS